MLNFLFAALLISGSPTPAAVPAATKPAAELDAKAQAEFDRLQVPATKDWEANNKSYVASFPKLAPILSKLAKAEKVTLFEGLPHPTWESQLLAEESKRKDSEQQHGYGVYTPDRIDVLATTSYWMTDYQPYLYSGSYSLSLVGNGNGMGVVFYLNSSN